MPARKNPRAAVRKTISHKGKKNTVRKKKASPSETKQSVGTAAVQRKAIQARRMKATEANKAKNTLTSKSTSAARTSKARNDQPVSKSLSGKDAPLPVVNCTIAPMQIESLLLPTNVIAEVIEYIDPAPVASTPQWFLGQIDWENRQIPVFSYAALINGSEPAGITSKARIMIVKSLSDSARIPYLGILVTDIPRLLTVQMDQVVHTGDERKSLGVFCHVNVRDQAAVIPDLDRLTHLVTHAAFGILPITQVGD